MESEPSPPWLRSPSRPVPLEFNPSPSHGLMAALTHLGLRPPLPLPSLPPALVRSLRPGTLTPQHPGARCCLLLGRSAPHHPCGSSPLYGTFLITQGRTSAAPASVLPTPFTVRLDSTSHQLTYNVCNLTPAFPT